jgi:hypothetical protein
VTIGSAGPGLTDAVNSPVSSRAKRGILPAHVREGRARSLASLGMTGYLLGMTGYLLGMIVHAPGGALGATA